MPGSRYHDFGRLVKRAGGEAILIIKDNTPAARADLQLFFEDPQAHRRTQAGSTHRLGKAMADWNDARSLPVLIESDYLHRDCGEVGQVFRLERERTSKDKQSREVVYGLSTLPQQSCPAQCMAQLISAHWAVENRLHWRRDATLGEDHCGGRFPPVAHMLAVLNSLVLALMDLHHLPNVARQRRRFASHPDEALDWVLDF